MSKSALASDAPDNLHGVECIYITGTRHSGSTVFGSALAAHAGVAFPGEIHYIGRALQYDEYCACGETASACAFWSRFAQSWSAADDWLAPADYEGVRSRRESIKQALFGGWIGRTARREQRIYAHTSVAVFEALRSAYGVSTVVDSSKSLGRLLQLLRMGMGRRMLVIHLVRDPLAVAASSRPLRNVDPAQGLEREVGGHAPWRTAAAWTLGNLAIAFILRLARLFGVRAQRVRYEHFVARPMDEFGRLGIADEAARAGEDQPMQLPVPMAGQHVLCGNHARMGGDTELRTPSPRTGVLTPGQQRLVRLMSLPVDRVLM
jgi:hypothetical protein